MTDEDRFMLEKISELEYRLEKAEAEARYYRKIAQESGKKRLREVDQLSRLIAERKSAQEEKAKLEVKLQQTQKMEAIGTMAAGVAHDLNNVLSGIVSYPDLLLMQLPEDSPLRNSILAIRNSGKKAATIVQDLLTLARRGVALHETVNLNDIILEYLNSPEQKKLLSYHPGVEMESRLDPNLMNLSGSSVHLSKMIMNLVSNAAEAMPTGGKIVISTHNQILGCKNGSNPEPRDANWVVLSVSDSGTGITEEDKNKIFDPFYTKKKMGRSGTGLGMTVVLGTVQDHKGNIDLETQMGKGTTFTLSFPGTGWAIRKDKPISQIGDLMGRGESVLVVDDEKEQRQLASTLLEQLNYSVTSAFSGENALEYLKYHTTDLVILDMIMDPGMNGLETYKKILEIHPDQKAIFLSGFTETERVKEAQRLGAKQYIRKPYTLEELGKTVKAVIKPDQETIPSG